MVLTDRERNYLFSVVNDLYQNYNVRSLEGPVLSSILSKLSSTTVMLTEAENTRTQYLMQDQADLFSRLADPRLWHIIQGESGRGSGVGSMASTGLGSASGGATSFFNSSSTYNLAKAVLVKLKEDMGS